LDYKNNKKAAHVPRLSVMFNKLKNVDWLCGDPIAIGCIRISLKEAVAPRFAKLVVSEFYFTVFGDIISCK
jgi:hypothetical protein